MVYAKKLELGNVEVLKVRVKSQPVKPTAISRNAILIALLMLGGSIAIASEIVSDIPALATTPVSAETRQIDFTLSSQDDRSFASLVQQAENLAKKLIEKEFVENSSITKVSARIFGEHNGSVAPILVSTVYRSDWQRDPSMSELQRWTKYFTSFEIVMGVLQQRSPQSPLPVPPSNNVTPYRGD